MTIFKYAPTPAAYPLTRPLQPSLRMKFPPARPPRPQAHWQVQVNANGPRLVLVWNHSL